MTVTTNLRLPDELHARLKRAADDDRRSMNAEIVWLLETALTIAEQKE